MTELRATPKSTKGHPIDFPVQRWYPVSAALCLLIAAISVWQLRSGLDTASLLFAALSLGVGLWQLRATVTLVRLSADRVIVHAPLDRHEIEFRQLLSVAQEGRVNPTILLIYHPYQGTGGLLDLDDVETVALPGVQNQTHLLDVLEEQIRT